METKKYWAVWDRYEHHDSIVDVLKAKQGHENAGSIWKRLKESETMKEGCM